MVHDYAEDLLQSMQIIATECYKDQKFDETVICTIVDDRDYKNGHYIVSDGTIKFDAYSESQDYRIDDAVRVLIIKGDYSKKKYITGKCISGEQPLTYTSAIESVLDMTGNLFSTVRKLSGLVANSGNVTNEALQCEDTCIWSIALSDSEFKDIQQNSIYDAIVLKADFKTMLSNYDIVKGSYGLRMDVYTSISNKKQGLYLKRFYLDSSMMFGDPYNFIIFSQQDAKFNISNNETIHTMSLYFYQNNDFIYRSNSGEYKELPASIIGENLFISDIYVGMGTDLANVEDNKFVIYTHDDLKYNLSDNDSSNQKELGLIWYNKDENNKYVGFSNGRVRNDVNGGLTINPEDENSLKYIDYDEIEYLSNRSMINRLTAQQGRYDVPNTKEGLWLAADLSELEPLLKSIKTVVYSDLFAEFNKFNIRLGNLSQEDADIVNLFNTWIGDSGHFYNTETFENNVKDMIDYYKNGLKYAAAVQRNGVKDGKVSEIQIQEDGTEKEIIFTKPKGNLATYENALVGPIRGSSEQGILTFIIDQITNEELKDQNNITVAFLPRLKEILIDKYSSFLGAYDAYESRILEVIENLQKLITEFKDLVFEKQLPSGETDASNVKKFSQLLNYTNKDDFDKYAASDMSIYDNLYCVYWYKYQSGYVDEDDPFGGRDWQRIETDSPNIGLPTPHPEDAENVDIKFYPAKPLDTDAHALLNLTLPVDNKEEKYKAVLIYNHEPFNSNEIVFTNERYVIDEEIKNNIKIEHGDNSQNHYPLYGMDNVLIDATAYNRPRHLRLRYCNEKGDFDDSYLANASIYWYIPLNSTMLRYDLNDLGDIKDNSSEVISKGFTNDLPITDEDGKIVNNEIVDQFHRKGYACFYKKVTTTEDQNGNVKINSQDRYFTYRIKDYYNPTNTQNTIYCVIVKGQAKFETQIDLAFSTFGSNGTDYTLKISPLTSQVGVSGDSGNEEGAMPFKFKIALYDYNNEQVKITRGGNSSAAAGTAILSSVSIQGPNSVIKEYDVNSDLIFENDGTVTGSVILEKKNPPCYYRVLTASVKIKWTGPDGKELDETKQGRTVELSTYYIIPYTPHLGYYVEGPTTVVYDSQGNNPSYYKNPFKLFENTNVLSKQNEELQGVESKEVPNTEWSIIYYDVTGAEVNYNDLDNESKKHYRLLMSYMPKLAGDNTLVPCNMYLSIDEPVDGQKETLYNLYPTVLCKQAGIIIWAQPIYLMQNRYPSAMLNAWDGKLQIDEENGTILSNLVGAGKKNIDNSFSGVLMGEIESKTGITIEGTNSLEYSLAQNQTGMGLYGFHEGAQSFGFNINGTAFLGKSGGGRISFDGNHGFIYSGAWLNSFKKGDGTYDNPFNIDENTKNVSLKQGKAGMAIDLQDGHIDAFNFRLTSNGIQLNSSPDTESNENYFLIGHEPGTVIENKEYGADSSYLKYDSQGNLTLQVNEFQLTGTMGNVNLLNDTWPEADIGEEIGKTYWNSYQQDQLSLTASEEQDNLKSIKLYNIKALTDIAGESVNYRVIRQNITSLHTIEKNSKYILSGKIYSATGGEIIFRLGLSTESHIDQTIVLERDVWNDIKIIFRNDKETELTPILSIYDYHTKESEKTYFYHLKLEEGTVATSWNISAQDIEDRKNKAKEEAKNYAEEHFKNQFTQDSIFNTLTNNGEVKGIFLGDYDGDEKKDLYINADYIASSILRSANWKAEYKIDGKTYDETQLNEILKNHPNLALTEIQATEGMYINLNDGKIWSKNFELHAGTQNSTDYIGLFSNDDCSPTLSIGDSGELSYWRIIAGNKFGVTKEGEMYASAGNIAGWTISDTSLIKGTPGDNNSICLYSDDKDSPKLSISDSDELSSWRIIAGNKFGVTKDGEMYAGAGKIAGWTISDTSLIKGTPGDNDSICLYSRHPDSGVYWRLLIGPNFKVDKWGTLRASNAILSGSIDANLGGTIGGWTIEPNIGLVSNIAALYTTSDEMDQSLNTSDRVPLRMFVGGASLITKETKTRSVSCKAANQNTTLTYSDTFSCAAPIANFNISAKHLRTLHQCTFTPRQGYTKDWSISFTGISSDNAFSVSLYGVKEDGHGGYQPNYSDPKECNAQWDKNNNAIKVTAASNEKYTAGDALCAVIEIQITIKDDLTTTVDEKVLNVGYSALLTSNYYLQERSSTGMVNTGTLFLTNSFLEYSVVLTYDIEATNEPQKAYFKVLDDGSLYTSAIKSSKYYLKYTSPNNSTNVGIEWDEANGKGKFIGNWDWSVIPPIPTSFNSLNISTLSFGEMQAKNDSSTYIKCNQIGQDVDTHSPIYRTDLVGNWRLPTSSKLYIGSNTNNYLERSATNADVVAMRGEWQADTLRIDDGLKLYNGSTYLEGASGECIVGGSTIYMRHGVIYDIKNSAGNSIITT